jgi:hypothetical protein
MSAPKILLSTEWDPKNIQFSEIEKNKRGGKMVYIHMANENKRSKIILQTPPMAIPFGIQPYTESSTGQVLSYSLDVSFRGYDTDTKIQEFLEKMKFLDEIMITNATMRSQEYFGRDMGRDLVSEFYRPLVKEPTSGNWPPTFRCKIPMRYDQPDCQFFDENKQPCTIDGVTKGSTVKLLLELGSIWFLGNKSFGVTFKIMQCAVVNKPSRLVSYAFADEGGDLGHEDGGDDDDDGQSDGMLGGMVM